MKIEMWFHCKYCSTWGPDEVLQAAAHDVAADVPVILDTEEVHALAVSGGIHRPAYTQVQLQL